MRDQLFPLHAYCTKCGKRVKGEWKHNDEGYYPEFQKCECEKKNELLENIQLNLAKISLSLNDIAATLREKK